MKNKILLYGGTFNPIHNGHIRMAYEAVERLSFDRVIFIPSAIPPHKKEAIPFSHRLKMTKLATEGIDFFEVSDIESKRDKPSYTIDTIEYFKDKLGEDTQIYWLIGTDAVKGLENWHKPEELLEKCKFVLAEGNPYRNYVKQDEDLMGFLRRHVKKGIAPLPIINYFIFLLNDVLEISSTDIRERIFYNKEIRIKGLVSEKVEQYIYDNQLYKDKR